MVASIVGIVVPRRYLKPYLDTIFFMEFKGGLKIQVALVTIISII
jgi:hypothetical protein